MRPHPFEEIFQVELDCWCFGLEKLRGELQAGVVHRIIKDLQPVFSGAIEHQYIFDVVQTAERLFQAAFGKVAVKEIVFHILAQFPLPDRLNEDQAYTLARILDPVEQCYPGALEHIEKKWRVQRAVHARRHESGERAAVR